MKDIKEFIIEKFKINSKNVNNNFNYTKIINSIAEHFGFTKDDKDEEVVEVIEKWVTDNHIKEIFYYGDIETLEEGRNVGMPDDILDDFNSDYSNIEACQIELKKCKDIYSENYLTIKANENLLAFLGDYGGLYASKKKMT